MSTAEPLLDDSPAFHDEQIEGAPGVRLLIGDCRETLRALPDESVYCCVTSPPYYALRNYGVAGQIGREPSVEEYVRSLVGIFREVRRVLRKDGSVWLNLGDSYAGAPGGYQGKHGQRAGRRHTARIDLHKRGGDLKNKDLIGVPWAVAFALRADGWYLRADILWSKTNPLPESVLDRPTRAHEFVFLLTRSSHYYYDTDAVREPYTDSTHRRYQKPHKGVGPEHEFGMKHGVKRDGGQMHANPKGRMKRDVWSLPSQPYHGAHMATMPPALVEPCILAGCPRDGVVLDPFAGSGTVGFVARSLGRRAVLCEINPDYAPLIRKRVTSPLRPRAKNRRPRPQTPKPSIAPVQLSLFSTKP